MGGSWGSWCITHTALYPPVGSSGLRTQFSGLHFGSVWEQQALSSCGHPGGKMHNSGALCTYFTVGEAGVLNLKSALGSGKGCVDVGLAGE